MAVLKDLRRNAARLRDRMLYGRRDRRLKAEADAIRTGWADRALDALPPLPDAASDPAHEVHTLCGEGHAVMGMWASWSLLRFLPEGRLVVHSDGTLSDSTAARWRRLMPRMRIIPREEGLAEMALRLAPWPRVLDWTRSYHFGSKLGGFYALAETERLVDMDTDVLVLSDPGALRDCLADGDWRMAWNRDPKASYAYSESLLREVIGPEMGSLPERLNGGFMAAHRFGDDDWDFLDRALAALAEDPRTDPMRYWMHQTLIAVLASTKGSAARPLPQPYDIHLGTTRPDAVARHFVGVPGVRPRFFTEGVPAIVRDARARGQIPEAFCRSEIA